MVRTKILCILTTLLLVSGLAHAQKFKKSEGKSFDQRFKDNIEKQKADGQSKLQALIASLNCNNKDLPKFKNDSRLADKLSELEKQCANVQPTSGGPSRDPEVPNSIRCNNALNYVANPLQTECICKAGFIENPSNKGEGCSKIVLNPNSGNTGSPVVDLIPEEIICGENQIKSILKGGQQICKCDVGFINFSKVIGKLDCQKEVVEEEIPVEVKCPLNAHPISNEGSRSLKPSNEELLPARLCECNSGYQDISNGVGEVVCEKLRPSDPLPPVEEQAQACGEKACSNFDAAAEASFISQGSKSVCNSIKPAIGSVSAGTLIGTKAESNLIGARVANNNLTATKADSFVAIKPALANGVKPSVQKIHNSSLCQKPIAGPATSPATAVPVKGETVLAIPEQDQPVTIKPSAGLPLTSPVKPAIQTGIKGGGNAILPPQDVEVKARVLMD